jgi:hypothetical protein
MRSGLVVKADVLGDEATKVLLAEDRDVIEQLATEGADEALGERVHIGRARCRPHDADAGAFKRGRERPARLRKPT